MTSPDDPSFPWRSPTLYVILASSMIGVMGVSLLSPILPSLRGVFGISDAEAGLLITAYTLPGIFLTPFIGLGADRLGRRMVIVPLLIVFGTAGAAIAIVDEYALVLALRFVQGIGGSALVTLAITLIGDFYEAEQRDAVMGVNGSTVGIGAASYPLIGGALGAIRWEAPFLFFGSSIVVGLVALVVLREPEASDPTAIQEYLARMGAVIVLPRALAIFAALFLAFFVFYGAVLTALPLLLSDAFGLESTEIGPVISMTAVAMAITSSQYGKVARWRSAPQLVALGFVLFGASLLGLWLAPSPVFMGAALLIFGVGFGIVMPSIDTSMVTLVSGDLRAGMMGMRTSMLRLGQTLGPASFTTAATSAFASPLVGYRRLLLLVGLVVVVAGGVGYGALRLSSGEKTA